MRLRRNAFRGGRSLIERSPAGKLTYQHYVLFPDDGNRHEVIDGEHYRNPAPSTYHQLVSRRIQFQLYTQIELKKLGSIIDAPVDVHLGEFDEVQPDLVLVLETNRIITPSKVKGVPDLLVEIISPSSQENDRVLKRSRYEMFGVPEYWLVDPFDHQLIQLVLVDGGYQEVPHEDQVFLKCLPDVSINLNEVW
jgi:Uma2 family endonuclease